MNLQSLLDILFDVLSELPQSLEVHVNFLSECIALVFDLLRHALMLLKEVHTLTLIALEDALDLVVSIVALHVVHFTVLELHRDLPAEGLQLIVKVFKLSVHKSSPALNSHLVVMSPLLQVSHFFFENSSRFLIFCQPSLHV